jgi:hypothetical protein
MVFAMIAVLTVVVRCTQSKATKADIKTAQSQSAAAEKDRDEAAREADRQTILSMRDITLADLCTAMPASKAEIEKAAGYAVFDATGVFVVLYVGITGKGVLIGKSNSEATYMTMARAGT